MYLAKEKVFTSNPGILHHIHTGASASHHTTKKTKPNPQRKKTKVK
jgi:hypothetical protein